MALQGGLILDLFILILLARGELFTGEGVKKAGLFGNGFTHTGNWGWEKNLFKAALVPVIFFVTCETIYSIGYCDSNINAQSKLVKKLFDNYDKRVIPQLNESTPVGLSVGIDLLNIVNLHEHEEVMETVLYLILMWDDNRLTWDPSRNNRIHAMHLPARDIWKPDISLYNNAELKLDTMDTLALIFNTGDILYGPRARIRTKCEVDLTKFPYDQQTCTIKFGSFTYSGREINISLHREKEAFDMTDYTANKEWSIVDTSATILTKKFACCPEPYQHTAFTLTLQRNSVYYVHVYVLPAVILAILVPFQFLLPPDSQERLTIGTGILIGCLLLIGMINSFLPEAHPNLPYIVQYYCLTTVWTGLSIILSILVINTHNRGPRNRKVPGIIRQIFLKTLKRVFCLTETYYPLEDSETISLKGLDKTLLNTSDSTGGKQQASKMERDIEEILRCLNTLIARNVVNESRRDVRLEWYQVAIVVDRILCFFFFVIFVIYSCVLLA